MKKIKFLKTFTLALLLFFISVSSAISKNYEQYAVPKYDKKNYPKFYQVWGDAWMKKINELAPSAAEYVAKQSKCDKLEILALSESRSKPKKEIVFFGDCTNGQRFYVSDADLKTQRNLTPQSEKLKGISDEMAIKMCEKEVRAELMLPSSFNKKIFTTNVYRPQTLGNIVINFNFTAENVFNQKIPKKMRCVITDSKIEVTISD